MLTAADARKLTGNKKRDRGKEYLEELDKQHREYVNESVRKILVKVEREAKLGFSDFSFSLGFYANSAIRDILKELKVMGYRVKRSRFDNTCTLYW